MSKYDEVIKPFVQLMEKELHANAGKGDRPGWLSMSTDTCLLEIIYHFGKLQASVKRGDIEGITEYAADVANMSMMLVDICGALPAQENHISERDQLKAENEALRIEVDSVGRELVDTELRATKFYHRFVAACDLSRELRIALEAIVALEDPSSAAKIAHDALEPFRASAAAKNVATGKGEQS